MADGCDVITVIAEGDVAVYPLALNREWEPDVIKVEMTDRLKRAWLKDCHWAKKMLLKKGSVSPMFILHARAGGAVPIEAKWPDEEAKSNMLSIVASMATAIDAIGVAYIGEAWLLIDPKSMDEKPSTSDKRKDCLIVTMQGQNDFGNSVFLNSIYEIRRDASGRADGATPIDFPEDNPSMQGAFAEVLSNIRPTPQERLEAVKHLAMRGLTIPEERSLGFPIETSGLKPQ